MVVARSRTRLDLSANALRRAGRASGVLLGRQRPFWAKAWRNTAFVDYCTDRLPWPYRNPMPGREILLRANRGTVGGLYCWRRFFAGVCGWPAMKTSEKQAYGCADIPLAARMDSEDTNLRMHLAHVPRLDYLQPFLDCISSERGSSKQGSPMSLLSVFRRAQVQLCFWKNVRRAEAAMRQSDVNWFEILNMYRSGGKFLTVEEDQRRAILDRATETEKQLLSILSALPDIERRYPKLSARLRFAIERILKVQCENIPTLVRGYDEGMLADAERHYAQGTLMELKTFANGLQRYQPQPSGKDQ